MQDSVTIAEAVRRTGLSADVIRIWERRYRAVAPARERGIRHYSEQDVRRLRLLAFATAQGERISLLAKLSNDQLAALAGSPALDAAPSMGEAEEARGRLLHHASAAERQRIEAAETFLQALYEQAVLNAARGLSAEFASIFDYQADTNRLVRRAHHGWKDLKPDVHVPVDGSTVVGRAFLAGKPIALTPWEYDAGYSDQSAASDVAFIKAAFAVAFGSGNNRGVLAVYTEFERTFSESDGRFLDSIVRSLGAAVDNRLPSAPVARQAPFEDVLAALDDPVVAFDFAGRVIYSNQTAQALRGDINQIGRPIYDVMPHLKVPAYRNIIDRAIARRTYEKYEFYSTFLNAWYEATVYPIANGLAMHCRNINHLKATAAHRGFKSGFARTLLRSVPAAIWTVDPELTVLSAAGKLTAMFGYRKGDLLGKSLKEIFGEPDANSVVQAHVRACDTGSPVRALFRHRGIVAQVVADAAIGAGGQPQGTIGFAIAEASGSTRQPLEFKPMILHS